MGADGYFAAGRIYCSMENMICLYTKQKEEKKNRLWQAAEQLLSLPYPLTQKSCTVLEVSIRGYGIEGITEEEILALERISDDGRQGRRSRTQDRKQRRRQRRWKRTLRHIKQELRKKEMQNRTGRPEGAFLFCSWKEECFPTEMLLRFYRDCCKENLFVLRAEQLIFLDGWEKPVERPMLWSLQEEEIGEASEAGKEDEREGALALEERPEEAYGMEAYEAEAYDMDTEPEMEMEDRELAFLSEVYHVYNYATIVTDRPKAWEEFAEMAYEEYGLSVRCVRDGGMLSFPDKKTLIVDMGRRGRRCMRNFPRDSVYMDMWWTRDKRRRIAAKCGKIPYVSLRNLLDTALRDGV